MQRTSWVTPVVAENDAQNFYSSVLNAQASGVNEMEDNEI